MYICTYVLTVYTIVSIFCKRRYFILLSKLLLQIITFFNIKHEKVILFIILSRLSFHLFVLNSMHVTLKMLNLHTFAGYTWNVDRKRLQYSRLTNGNRIELCFSNLHRSRNPKHLPRMHSYFMQVI